MTNTMFMSGTFAWEQFGVAPTSTSLQGTALPFSGPALPFSGTAVSHSAYVDGIDATRLEDSATQGPPRGRPV